MRRDAVRRAQGRAVAFVDSDDWHDPQRLPAALDALDAGAEVVAQPWARCDGTLAVSRAARWPCLQALVARTEIARAHLDAYPSVPSGDCLDGDGHYATALHAHAVHIDAPAPAFVAVIHPASTTARVAVWRLPPRQDAPPEALAHARHVVGLSRHHAP